MAKGTMSQAEAAALVAKEKAARANIPAGSVVVNGQVVTAEEITAFLHARQQAAQRDAMGIQPFKPTKGPLPGTLRLEVPFIVSEQAGTGENGRLRFGNDSAKVIADDVIYTLEVKLYAYQADPTKPGHEARMTADYWRKRGDVVAEW